MALREQIEAAHRIGKILTGVPLPASWLMIGRRTSLGDDKCRRLIERWEEGVEAKLVELRDGRLTLSATGCRFQKLIEGLIALKTQSAAGPQEPLNIEAAPELAEWLLPRVFPAMFETYGEYVRTQIRPFDPARVRSNIRAGLTDLAIGFASEETESPADEVLETSRHWLLIFPDSFGTRPEGALLAASDRVFVARGNTPQIALEALSAVPESAWTECGTFAAVRACVSAGLGAGLVPAIGVEAKEYGEMPLTNVAPVGVAIYRPRNLAGLSDPARTFLTAIRDVFAVTNPPVTTGEMVSTHAETNGELA
ncbi:LysR substrate-binding domain-containing protein [Fimbriiglobus ruber]|uniref:LysR substrate-binding domain-containing protein n=1 Tax=Fimbriiglobus ruber TaxID=1908690 RepID=A0A225EAR9_9BACT|nr:LysR substrate-binding domain-containing protein [Fimbriiglobus ruber]OWK46479.1 hypothetical protein FRUB_00178 [Fimbriiglobus ruber]